jgi:hypothetical protein
VLLQICARLFRSRGAHPIPLKRLTMAQVEDFRQHGYLVLDSFISREAAARIKADVSALYRRGALTRISTGSTCVQHGSTCVC